MRAYAAICMSCAYTLTAQKKVEVRIETPSDPWPELTEGRLAERNVPKA